MPKIKTSNPPQDLLGKPYLISDANIIGDLGRVSWCGVRTESELNEKGNESFAYCQTNLERIWRLWLEINNRDLFKCLRVFMLETQLGIPRKCSKEEGTVKGPCSEKCILENNQSCLFFALRLVQGS